MLGLAAVVLMAAVLVPAASAQSQYIYVANAGDDTVSKIDINTDTEEARYATWFTPLSPNYNQYPHGTGGPAPSRIARNSGGYVYVLNRFFPQRTQSATQPANMHLPVLVKIAPSGGTPTTTSSGSTVMQMLDNGTIANQIDAGDQKDARILWGQPIGAAGVDEGWIGRSLCMDKTGVLWVGIWGRHGPNNSVLGTDAQKYYRVDPATGNVLGPPILTRGHSPYGCQVDAKGRLWSIDYFNELLEIDTATFQLTPHNHAAFGKNYSLSLFSGCGSEPTKVYISEQDLGNTYIAYDPQAPAATAFSTPPPTVPKFKSVAIGVDQKGNIISGERSGGRIVKSTPGGTVLWDTNTLPAGPVVTATTVPPVVPPQDLHGIIIDDHDDVWAVHMMENRVVKYSGGDGHYITSVRVGNRPYTYGNPPPPTCPCARIGEQKIKCEGKNEKGEWIYSWSFTFTNNSPFSMPATGIEISVPSGSPIIQISVPPASTMTGLAPANVQFPNAVPPNGQATVSGTFTLNQPVPGSQVCFDIRLNFGDLGWCCPTEHVCFALPECPTCAKLEAKFACDHGHHVLQLSVTNVGPTAAQGAQIISNTPGVTVSPQTTNLAFPQNTPVIVPPLTITGATPGQTINLSVMLHGPIDEKTGVYSWCCTATVTVTYPIKHCLWWWDGEIFDDINLNGLRDSGENGLGGWTVTLTDGKGTPRTTTSNDSGAYHFEEIEPAPLRVSVQPPKGWRATTPKGGAYSLSLEAPPKGKLDFGFVKTR
jgi:hypothetical protein